VVVLQMEGPEMKRTRPGPAKRCRERDIVNLGYSLALELDLDLILELVLIVTFSCAMTGPDHVLVTVYM
jgi:hypothetical protein